MAIYTVKLVDRRSSGSHEMSAIQKQVERVLGLAFVGTNDSVSASWGAGAESDNLVVHFVEDISNSYLRKTWPNIAPFGQRGPAIGDEAVDVEH